MLTASNRFEIHTLAPIVHSVERKEGQIELGPQSNPSARLSALDCESWEASHSGTPHCGAKGKEGASHRSKYQLSNQIANSKLQIEKIAFVIVGHWTMDIAWLSSKTITDDTLATNIACHVMEENKKVKITIL